MKKTNSQRLHILSDNEINTLYAIPEFDPAERSHYFDLPKPLLDLLAISATNGRHTSAKLYFILQYGYFKARHQFYNIGYGNVKSDVHFIMQQYMPNDSVPRQLPTRKTQLLVRKQILQHMGFYDDKEKQNKLITEKASSLATTTYNPVEIFNEVIKSLQTSKIVLPAYSRLQDLIGRAIWAERRRLINMVRENLTEGTRRALEDMLRLENGLYHITEIKLDAKSFQAGEMQAEIKKLFLCRPIYLFATTCLPKLGLSRRMTDHYADLAKLYIAPKLGRLPRELAFLYMICYIHKRYEKLTNNLIQAFIYYVDKYHNEAKKHAKDKAAMLEDPLERYRTPVGKLIKIFTNKKIMDLSGNKIKKHALKVMPEERIIDVSSRLLDGEKNRKKEEQRLVWEHHKEHFQAILINLRPLFMAIDFEGSEELEHLFTAIQFLKNLFQQGNTPKDIPLKEVPTTHIRPTSLLECFIESTDASTNKSGRMKSVDPWQYEFHVYRSIRENIKSKKIHINSSSDYRSFESEIKVPHDWIKNEKNILSDINNPVLLRPIEDTLAELENILEPLIERVNKRAVNGENLHIKIKQRRDGTCEWTIPYPKRKIDVDNPFYDNMEIKTISEVYDFVSQKCGFMKAFTHIKPHKGKAKADYPATKGGILADGTPARNTSSIKTLQSQLQAPAKSREQPYQADDLAKRSQYYHQSYR